MMRRGLQFLLALALILAVPSLGWCAQDIFMIDAHSQIPAHVSEEEALSWMDKAGIGRAILSPVGGHDVHKLLEFARAHPDRVTPSIPLKNKAFRNGDPAALERVRRMGRHRLFGAMSEVMVAHERKADVAPEIVLGLDAASVQTALSIALKRDWPLVIHIEFGFAASLGKYDFYMAALEDLLRRYPEHPFVLSHMGQLHADAAKRLIDSHANIYFLTSHANPIFIGDQRHILPWTNLFSGSKLASEWKALFVAHPDQFILAFDNVYDPDWGNRYVNQAQLWRSALADLPVSVANAVAHGNAERLWHLTGRRPVDAGAGAEAGAGGSATIDPATLPASDKDLLAQLIASGFGAETNVDGRKRSEPHKAVDIRGRVGDDILAAADGQVVFAGPTPRGLAVNIFHGRNVDGSWYVTRYVHNSENLVTKGDHVRRGQVIAHLGDSGSKTVPHVHFQVVKSAAPRANKDEQISVDPNLYWEDHGICFDRQRAYPDRPLRFTLPVRCPQ